MGLDPGGDRLQLPCLTTDRLRLRPWRPLADAAAALQIYGDPQVVAHLGPGSKPDTIATVQRRLQRYYQVYHPPAPWGCWAVEEPTQAQVIGHILLIPLADRHHQPSHRPEIGWHFRPSHWGQGYATEAAAAVLHHGLHHWQMPAIYGVIAPHHDRSRRLALRLGMVDLGLTRHYYGGRELSLFRYSV
ncbi:GNAT family N-acetyltransferase [Prochlorothrix hollandica]|uniref:N-acetyltransferase domain-containing protein n=1 Tax=Prochlorothrix hollandica PCC 9006 = CALU 1027 TaxID=317619 RepID=A0A0M2PYJ8_PROHO|nr:GNAT family N-acetyltransferase [Prochlorothrix hollandica]KKI99456.1 hypothetical protein PROH_12705 [Prochlorothrix hollandica PCC 9006 = CALU 1027]